MPETNGKNKFEVSYFNNNCVSFVPASALYDFVANFNYFIPKSLSKSARDQAILDALSDLNPEILKEEREKLLKNVGDATSISSGS